MYQYRLAKQTEIRYPSFSGRESCLILDPCDTGRFWSVGGHDVPLTAEMIHLGWFHHLYLQSGKTRMRMAEHFLPLLGHGVTGFRMTMKTSGLPYDGRGQLFWESVKPNLRLHGFLKPYAPPFHTLASTTRWLRGTVPRRITYMRTNEAHLTVRIKMDYGLGKQYEKDFVLPRDWDHVITARHRGRNYLYQVARAASRLGWPHIHHIAWEQELDIRELLEEEARHRVLDLLGYAALHVPDGCMLTGTLISNCAGHADDHDLFSKWRNELARAAL